MARKKPKKQLPPKRPRTKPHRYTSEQVIDALKKTNGLQYLAARMLKMCQTSMSDYCKRPEVKEVLVQLRGENVDHAEKQLQRAVKRKEQWAVKYTLSCLGKDRGYVERTQTEMSGPDGKPIPIGLDATERTARIALLLERLGSRGAFGVPGGSPEANPDLATDQPAATGSV
jgi:hypothetical protein